MIIIIVIRSHRMHDIEVTCCCGCCTFCCLCVCLLGTLVIPAKTDELIQMSFGVQTAVGPRNMY